MLRLRTASVAMMLAVLVVVLVPTAPAYAVTLDSAKSSTPGVTAGYAKKLVAITNRKRAKHGLKPVKVTVCARKWSRSWAAHLDTTNSFAHGNLGKLLDRCDATYASENLAMIYDGATPADIVSMWMRSSGHRKNLLSRSPNRVGITVRWDQSRGVWLAVQNFVRT